MSKELVPKFLASTSAPTSSKTKATSRQGLPRTDKLALIELLKTF